MIMMRLKIAREKQKNEQTNEQTNGKAEQLKHVCIADEEKERKKCRNDAFVVLDLAIKCKWLVNYLTLMSQLYRAYLDDRLVFG